MTEETRRGYKIQIQRESLENPTRSSAAASSESSAVGVAEDQVLLIDGERVPYLKTKEGYKIYYGAPSETLLEAAQRYVDTQREK